MKALVTITYLLRWVWEGWEQLVAASAGVDATSVAVAASSYLRACLQGQSIATFRIQSDPPKWRKNALFSSTVNKN